MNTLTSSKQLILHFVGLVSNRKRGCEARDLGFDSWVGQSVIGNFTLQPRSHCCAVGDERVASNTRKIDISGEI